MDYNEIAEEILENYTNTYCQADVERVAKVLKEISRKTAEKILCELLKGFAKNFYLKNMSMTEEEFGWVLDEIAREYGVEIKE